MKAFFKRLLKKTLGTEVDFESISDVDICNRYGDSVLRSHGQASTHDQQLMNENVLSILRSSFEKSDQDQLKGQQPHVSKSSPTKKP